jgi:hypothetical protein
MDSLIPLGSYSVWVHHWSSRGEFSLRGHHSRLHLSGQNPVLVLRTSFFSHGITNRGYNTLYNLYCRRRTFLTGKHIVTRCSSTALYYTTHWSHSVAPYGILLALIGSILYCFTVGFLALAGLPVLYSIPWLLSLVLLTKASWGVASPLV